MQYTATSSAIRGRIQAPASKSVAQRAIAVAALTRGTSHIDFPGQCDDVMSAIRVARQLGAVVEETDTGLRIRGGVHAPAEALNCGESGLGIRMFSGLAATLDTQVELTGEGSLLKRPMLVVQESLQALGVSCMTTDGLLPIYVKGPIRGGEATIDGSLSSQVLTGLLIAAPFAVDDVQLKVKSLKSKEYADITSAIMQHFGVIVNHENYEVFTVKAGQTYRPAHLVVEGDWSGAAFLLVAGAVAGSVTVENIHLQSRQPDRHIIAALQHAGAYVHQSEHAVEVRKQDLLGFNFDATHCPDLFPPLVALAANCRGNTYLRGAGRLKAKESDRAATLIDIFGKLGVRVVQEDDFLIVTGGEIRGGTISSHEDHRIAMAGAVAALNASSPVIIDKAEAINKSYPDFYKIIETLKS